MTEICHFYHLWADGQWEIPAAQHFAALDAAGFCGRVAVGLVGSVENRSRARSWLDAEPGIPWECAVEADAGWEQVTLRKLAAWTREHRSAAVLYAHGKGSYGRSEINEMWRRSMTSHVVGRWRECVELLKKYDATGCHWLTPEVYPDQVTTPFFGGNFWWARASYLAALPACGVQSRWDAEAWIGLGYPKVHDLLPGWPSPDVFHGIDSRRAGKVVSQAFGLGAA